MKEIVLATTAKNVYAGSRITFMNDTGVIEKPPTPPTAQPKEQLLPVGPVIMGEAALPTLSEDFGYDLTEIPHPSIRQSLEALDTKTGQRPISSWTTEELKQAYEAIADTQASLDKLEKPNSFGERDHESAIQLYRVPVLQELEARNVDIKELNKALAQKYPEVFEGKGTIGAARRIDPAAYPNPNLQNVIRDLNGEVTAGRGNSEYLKNLIDRVDDMIDSNIIPPGDVDEAINLVIELRNQVFETVGEEQTANAKENTKRVLTGPGAIIMDRISEWQKENDDDVRLGRAKRHTTEDFGEEVFDLVREASAQRELNPTVIELAIQHDKALWYMVNRIIAVPLSSETTDYRLEFYEQNNATAIRQALRSRYETPGLPPEERAKRQATYNKYILLSNATQNSHEMNKQIVTGDLESFIRVARVITPPQLQILQNVKGVPMVMRLFEEAYQRALTKDTVITQEVYNKIVGEPIGEEIAPDGTRIERKTQGSVEILLGKLNERLTGEAHMEDWELEWALNVGKNMFNTSLRAGEIISLGVPPEGKKDISIPQESVARAMNWMGWIAKRFGIAEIRGGIALSDMAIHEYQEARGEQGYYETHMSKIGNRSLREFEYPGMFGVSGIFSGWRQEQIILDEVPMAGVRVDGREISIHSYVQLVNKNLKAEAKERKQTLTDDQLLRRTFLDNNGELQEGFSSALAVLMKNGVLNASKTDVGDKKRAKTDIRAAIWRRVARDNPLAMVNFLQGMEFSQGHTGIKDRLTALSKALSGDGDDGPEWTTLNEKLVKAHEARMRQIASGEQMTLDQAFVSEGVTLNAREAHLLGEIRTLGAAVSGEMANVRFPFTAFMNDVAFEKIKYGKGGAEFYRRRTGGDLPAFSNAYNEFSKLITNPGGMDPHKAMESMLAMVEALGSPQGTEGGQDKVEPFFNAYMEFTDDTGGIVTEDDIKHRHVGRSGLIQWLGKSSTVAGTLHTAGKPTSFAQYFAGMGAPAESEREVDAHLKGALQMGLINTEQYNKLKKKYKVQLGWLLAAFFRDILPFFVLATAIEVIDESVEGKK